MITIFPDYLTQTASRAAHKATQLTDPLQQLAANVDVAKSDDAELAVYITLDQFARIQPIVEQIKEKGGRVRYVVSQGSGMPLEAAWTQATSGHEIVEVQTLDKQDQQQYERQQVEKPLKEGSNYGAIRARANDRPGAKPVIPTVDLSDPDSWED